MQTFDHAHIFFTVPRVKRAGKCPPNVTVLDPPLIMAETSRCSRRRVQARKDCCIRGYHVYREFWEATIGEQLQCVREGSNLKDRYAVAVIKDDRVVGHLPKLLSVGCSVFIRRGGTIKCEVTGPKRYSADLPQGGLEIPCSLLLDGDKREVKKLLKVF